MELLIATTIAMIIMLIVTKWFRDLSVQMSQTRALVEMSGRIRSVVSQLETDLRNATFPRGSAPGTVGQLGYLQYVEGIASDAIPNWAANPLPVTVPNSPVINGSGDPIPAASGVVYFHNIDAAPLPGDPQVSRFGDMDDVLSLTSRNLELPYRGAMLFRTTAPTGAAGGLIPQQIESPMAEIVWWMEGYDENGDLAISENERRLHRRVFLIRPDLNNPLPSPYDDPPISTINFVWRTLVNGAGDTPTGLSIPVTDALGIMYQQCDISFTIDFTTDAKGIAIANSLADLAYPSNVGSAPVCRRITQGVPSRTALNAIAFQKVNNPQGIGRSRYGEDVMLSSATGFDIRIFDPMAPLWLHTDAANAKTVVSPGDPAYLTAAGQGVPSGLGAYVDLNYAGVRNPSLYGTGASWFSGPPSEYSGFFRTTNNGSQYTHLLNAYDTWAPLANNTLDGVDTNGNGVLDEDAELLAEMPGFASPGPGQYIASPYPFALRALQITIRSYDADSRQVRQLKAGASFTND